MPWKDKDKERAFFNERQKRRHKERRAAGLCRCGRRDPGGRSHCSRCSEKIELSRRKLYAKRKAAGICTGCGKAPAPAGFARCEPCRAKMNLVARRAGLDRYRAKLTAEVLAAYGGKCVCCGESEPFFLEVDHIFGQGGEHRRQIGQRGGTAFYFWLRRNGFPKDDFQLLCRNCNYGKHRLGGVCPHTARGMFPADDTAELGRLVAQLLA